EINVRQNDLGYLRTHLDLELGLGWERYLRCNKLHVDLSAGYGFQVFFGQIMFRRWLDDIDIGKSFNQVSNLFIQGLTARARLDF
ncbi:MAG TPA: hypothetical protein VLF94_06940, partial [Chlamydiales bacterium]|nr:hypothetical protein [Chlamydiales bacterium]